MKIESDDWKLQRHDNIDGTIQYEIWGTVGNEWGRVIVIDEDDWPNAKDIAKFIHEACASKPQ
jgi:hypothetical protein